MRPLTTHLPSQAEDDAADDFSPWQEGTSPTLVSVPNPVFGSHDAFCEPFDVSAGAGGLGKGTQGLVSVQPLTNIQSSPQDALLEDDFPDTQRIDLSMKFLRNHFFFWHEQLQN